MPVHFSIHAETANHTRDFTINVRQPDTDDLAKYINKKKEENPNLTTALDKYYQKRIKEIQAEEKQSAIDSLNNDIDDSTVSELEESDCNETTDNNHISNIKNKNLRKLIEDKPKYAYKETGTVTTPASIRHQINSPEKNNRNQNKVMGYVSANQYTAAYDANMVTYVKNRGNRQWGHGVPFSHNEKITTDSDALIQWLLTGVISNDKLISTQSRVNLSSITIAANLYMLEIEMAIAKLAVILKTPIALWNRMEIEPDWHIGVQGCYFILLCKNEELIKFSTEYDCRLSKAPYFECQKYIFNILEHVVSLDLVQPKTPKKNSKSSTAAQDDQDNNNHLAKKACRRLFAN